MSRLVLERRWRSIVARFAICDALIERSHAAHVAQGREGHPELLKQLREARADIEEAGPLLPRLSKDTLRQLCVNAAKGVEALEAQIEEAKANALNQ